MGLLLDGVEGRLQLLSKLSGKGGEKELRKGRDRR